MRTAFARSVGIDFPVVAFSHCRDDLLTRYGVPPLDEAPEDNRHGNISHRGAGELMQVAMSHRPALIANALGPPTPEMVTSAHDGGAVVASLVGRPEHAVSQLALDVDVLVAQGYEAGGHTGEEWDGPDSPGPLPMPLQLILVAEAQQRIARACTRQPGARELATYYVGQVVGLLDRERTTRQVMERIIEEYVETVGELAAGLEAADDVPGRSPA
ncbi:MAG TPA: nitronate monooxygenase [Pseudonocardia sp.]|jgi:NAD(P)H-dependent flavin oxidoreductase YrpB (nitropropane dioxygenase family)|nr:nitronate monooxygenase [Pseudonocardia sp.]